VFMNSAAIRTVRFLPFITDFIYFIMELIPYTVYTYQTNNKCKMDLHFEWETSVENTYAYTRNFLQTNEMNTNNSYWTSLTCETYWSCIHIKSNPRCPHQRWTVNRALVHQNPGVKYHAKGCMALRTVTAVKNNPFRAPGSTLSYVCLRSVQGSTGGDCLIPNFCGTNMEKEKKKNCKCHQKEPCNTGSSPES
jgi:hypothetical protein